MNVATVSSDNKIFLSYRREDSAGYARLIYDRLAARFPDQVFMDISGIGLGVDFVDSIRAAIGSSRVFIALIGKYWLSCKGPDGQLRLHDPRDFVRIEIRTALESGLTVIPVLLPGTVMPAAEDLPEDIVALAHRQALQITDIDLDENIRMLMRTLESELRPPSNAGRRLVLQTARIAIPVSVVLAVISDVMLPNTALTPLVALAFGALALVFTGPKFASTHIDSQQWPQLIRSQNRFLRVGVFFMVTAAMFAALAIAQKISGVESSKGILASKISALSRAKAAMFVSKRPEKADVESSPIEAAEKANAEPSPIEVAGKVNAEPSPIKVAGKANAESSPIKVAGKANAEPSPIKMAGKAFYPSISGMPSNSGWLISFRIPDQHPKEILYRLNDESTFTSTGFNHREVDQTTGLPMANSSVTLPNLGPSNVISLKYVDAQGETHGPFPLPFDAHQEYVNFTKDVLTSIPQWVSFREYPKDHMLVYFTNLLSYQNAFREIRYSVDNDSLSQKFPIKPNWDSPARIGDQQIYLDIPMTTKFVYVKLIYIDGTESQAKKFMLAESDVDRN